MIKSLSDKITSFLVCNNSIDNEDSEICSYGLEVLISSLINLVIILLIGVILGKLMQTVVFIVCYCSIRQFSGGYHASSHGKCIFTFLCMYIVTVLIVGNIYSTYLKPVVLLIGILSWISIFILVPVEHINNPLSDLEKIKNRKNARVIATLVLVGILLGLSLDSVYEYVIYSVLAIFWVNIMFILQIVKNKGEVKDEEIF